MTQRFAGKDEDAAFKEWMRQHAEGFYLNATNRAGEAILHRVGCPYLPEDKISTTYAKIAAETSEALLDEARRHNLSVRVCGACKPDEAA